VTFYFLIINIISIFLAHQHKDAGVKIKLKKKHDCIYRILTPI